MRLIHVKSAGILSEHARRRLEDIFYVSTHSALIELKRQFPDHTVLADDGYIRVTNKDRSINVAVFKEELTHPRSL
jgi:hypothetical protein